MMLLVKSIAAAVLCLQPSVTALQISTYLESRLDPELVSVAQNNYIAVGMSD